MKIQGMRSCCFCCAGLLILPPISGIIGKLIPAGAGLNAYRHFAEELVPEVEPAPAAQTEETAPAAPADDAALSDED